MQKTLSLILILFMFTLTACETQMNEPATGALLGAGAGAGLGAIIGHQSGHTGAGTAIGAGSGALIGAMIGEANRRSRERTKQEIREEMYGQGYYREPQYNAPPPQQPSMRQVHTKYNPKTGRTFPESYTYDPDTGDELVYIS